MIEANLIVTLKFTKGENIYYMPVLCSMQITALKTKKPEKFMEFPIIFLKLLMYQTNDQHLKKDDTFLFVNKPLLFHRRLSLLNCFRVFKLNFLNISII